MSTRLTALSVGLWLALAPTLATANSAAFDKAMEPIVAAYAVIHKALAADSEKGIAQQAKRIVKLAAELKPVTGTHAAHYKKLPQTIKVTASKLGQAKGLAAQRKAFMALSRPLALWVTMSRPAGIDVVFCSMAKGSWLQREKEIANPYYGAKMLRCGEVVSGEH